MGLSLWIVPNTEDSKLITSIMNVRPTTATAPEQSPESYPKFYPHITLASLPFSMKSSLEAIELVLSKMHWPPTYRFASVDVGSEYYRSVYVAIHLTTEISSLHRQIHEELNITSRTPYFPHLSLCYITNADAESGQREKYRQALEENGNMRTNSECGQGRGIILCFEGPEGEHHQLDQFVAYEIWAVNCEGPVEEWEVLKKFGFPENIIEQCHSMNPT
ncbi:LigT-like protein [Pholiota conissans]|uniref:LigT-like protein n=1 Tax=Pholiota conissans TaxID=109636 RepID=A0A9P5YQ13_9AGAR|nr:LigT-like protein [Pholiota conissans]